MAYEGGRVTACYVFKFSKVAVVIVSGAAANPCGHALLFVDENYFHVARFRGYPFLIPGATKYARYLKENGKREIRRIPVVVKDSQAANLKLNELLSKKWTWGILPNNCVAFVEEVLAAGGVGWSCWHNCPEACGAN